MPRSPEGGPPDTQPEISADHVREFFAGIANAERSLREAFDLLDGTDGCTGVSEYAFSAAIAAINAIREAETGYYALLADRRGTSD